MKSLITVLKFELLGFIKNKSVIISTAVMMAIVIIGMSVPTVMRFFDDDRGTEFDQGENGSSQMIYDKDFAVFDQAGNIKSIDLLQEGFPEGEVILVQSEDELKDGVESGLYYAGFIIENESSILYVVNNSQLMDFRRNQFESAWIHHQRVSGFDELGIPFSEVTPLIFPQVYSETLVLGTDGASNYWYAYILVFGLYFLILFYGQAIATSVASEKSNRSMEILVTSTKSKNLIMGKVLGSAIAGVLQFGLVILTAYVAYQINAPYWSSGLDFEISIPTEIILPFAAFAVFGYLFYAFIFGALGALVSRTEDVASSSTVVTTIFVVVFMVTMFGLQSPEGLILTIASFIPFSSFMAMFARISMGTVATWEVLISFGLLIFSTWFIAILASKIYRMGTLMYGNPVKLKDVYKIMKSQ